jgi:3-hydroxyisobutyrate dehydrogenase
MRVAVLGTGIMGAPMARNLAAAGHQVTAWNRSAEKAEGIDGVTAAGSVAEAVREAEAVITMLADADAVEAVVHEALPALDAALLVQTSTIGPEATARLAEQVPGLVDAPVLGT